MMTANLDVSVSKITTYTVDSWNPPMAYGAKAALASAETPEDGLGGQKRSRQYTAADLNAFWSASSFLGKSVAPYVSGDQPQRVAFSDSFAISRKNRVTVSSKSPPSVVGFVVADEDTCDSVDSVKVNIDASLCAASIESKTIVWSLPSDTSRDEYSASKTYNALFLPHGMQRFEIPTGKGVTSLDFSPDSPVMLAGSSRGQVGLWSIEAARKLVSYTGHSSRTPVWDLAWSPAGGYFATSSGDGAARIWRSDVPYPIRALHSENGSLHYHMVKWHPSCQIVAVASQSDICLFEISGATILFRFHCKSASAMEFSPTGYLFASANTEALTVWETSTGSEIFRFDTFSPIVGLSWSHPSSFGLGDGGLKSALGHSGVGHPVLISIEESGIVRIWDKLFISKPSVCELTLMDSFRPLHMHVTSRNLLVVAGTREDSQRSSFENMFSS
jgi:WD40 repeat protein